MNDEFNPLGAPGGNLGSPSALTSPSALKAGAYVTTAVNSTPFFLQRPSDNSTAEFLLPAGTMMRVVKPDSSFVKVELDDGKVGFVAVAMIRPPASANTSFMPNPTTIGSGLPSIPNQIAPSSVIGTGSGMAIPKVDPSTGLPMPPVTLPSDALPPSSVESSR